MGAAAACRTGLCYFNSPHSLEWAGPGLPPGREGVRPGHIAHALADAPHSTYNADLSFCGKQLGMA